MTSQIPRVAGALHLTTSVLSAGRSAAVCLNLLFEKMKHARRAIVVPLALSITLIGTPLSAQTNESPHALQVYSRIVSLDVVVKDKNGKIVSGLSKEDFSVYEDRRPQTIRNFESIQDHYPRRDASASIVRSSADLRNNGGAPVTVLVLDEMLTKFGDMAYSRSCIERYLKQQPAVLPQPTELLVVRSDKFLVLHDFTQDRNDVLSAIHRYQPLNPKISGIGAGNGKRIVMALGSLEQIAKSQIGTSGRKNIVWIGKGFPSIDPVGGSISEPLLESFETSLHLTVNLLLRAHAVLFVIDPDGLQGGGMAPAVLQTGDESGANGPSDAGSTSPSTGAEVAPDQSEFSFASLAPLTGGAFLYNKNDIDGQIEKSLEDGTNYYTLSYVPDSDSNAAAQYRHIRVIVHRPGLYVQTRQGYYPPEATSPVKEKPTEQEIASTEEKIRLSDLIDAAANRLDYTAISIDKPTRIDDNNYRLHVKASDLRWLPKSENTFIADVALFVVGFSPQGKITGRSYLEIRKTTSAPPLPGDNAQVVYDLPFHPLKGSSRLRFVVRDLNSPKIGTADTTSP